MEWSGKRRKVQKKISLQKEKATERLKRPALKKTRSKKERKKEKRKRRRSDSLVSLVKEPGDRYNERENDKRKIVKE